MKHKDYEKLAEKMFKDASVDDVRNNWIENQIQDLKDDKDYLDEMKAKYTDDILVPENIKFEEYGDGDMLGIIFNDGKQSLSYEESSDYVVTGFTSSLKYNGQCKLIPCKREDLKTGDTAFKTNMRNTSFSDINNYCKILNESDYVYIVGKGVLTNNAVWEYWYKVVRCDE